MKRYRAHKIDRPDELTPWGVVSDAGGDTYYFNSSEEWGKEEAEEAAALYNQVADDESARIRRELKQEIFRVFERLVAQSAPGELHGIESELLAALDRICPEEG